MLKSEFRDLKVGDTVYYQSFYNAPPYTNEVVRHKAKVIEAPKNVNLFQASVDVALVHLDNEHFFTNKDIYSTSVNLYFTEESKDDYLVHRGFTLVRVPSELNDLHWAVNIYIGTYLVAKLEQEEVSYSLRDAVAYVEVLISNPEIGPQLEPQIKEAVACWVANIDYPEVPREKVARFRAYLQGVLRKITHCRRANQKPIVLFYSHDGIIKDALDNSDMDVSFLQDRALSISILNGEVKVEYSA